MADEIRQKVEDEWFARHEQELLREARVAHEQRMKQLEEEQRAGEERRLRELHFLKCPKCGYDMNVLQVSSIEVEQCGRCEGIFLDRGELDELLLKRPDERRGFFRKLMRM